MTKMTTGTTTDDDNDSTPVRAVVVVAYLHASIGDEKVREAQQIMLEALMEDGPDWVDDACQMVMSTIVPLSADEAIEYYVDDMDDLDDDEVWELDDFRDTGQHGSTPR